MCLENSAKKNGISASSVGEGNDDEFARNAGGRVNGHRTLHSHFHVVSAVDKWNTFSTVVIPSMLLAQLADKFRF